MYSLTQPETDDDFRRYYHFRWRMLRAPWHQPEGSERDNMEDQCFHLMALNKQQQIIACGRLQFNIMNEAQIRYMAVDKRYQHQGIGRQIMKVLEREADKHGISMIIVNAREPAVGFYQRLGFKLVEKNYLLFGVIQHYSMTKVVEAV